MPWAPIDAHQHTHQANTKKKAKVWAQIANKILRDTKDEARAIREANAAVARIKD